MGSDDDLGSLLSPSGCQLDDEALADCFSEQFGNSKKKLAVDDDTASIVERAARRALGHDSKPAISCDVKKEIPKVDKSGSQSSRDHASAPGSSSVPDIGAPVD